MLKKSLLPLAVAGILTASSRGFAEVVSAAPSATATETTTTKRVPLTVDELMSLLDIQAWKWQVPLPAGTENVIFYCEEWRKGEKEPRLHIIHRVQGDLSSPKLHEIMVRWPDNATKRITCSMDGMIGRSSILEDGPFKEMGYALQVRGDQDMSKVNLDEPFTLVAADYRHRLDGTFGHDAFKPGPDIRSERILIVKMYATVKPVVVLRWSNGHLETIPRREDKRK